jgi:2-phosphosulfolactate phosphatase
MIYDQAEYGVRCEWGMQGVEHLAPISDVVIIVDVLSFCTCVDVAVGRGALVYPFGFRNDSARTYAVVVGAHLASPQRGADGYTLSPASLLTIPPETRVVLPSPNGSTLSVATGDTPTLAGCLRNAHMVAAVAHTLGERIAVIPAGERWRDGSLRPAWEDWVGAGAIIAHLPGARSPEAESALAAFRAAAFDLPGGLQRCSSGRELVAEGYAADVELAAALDVSDVAPILRDGAYRRD